MRKRMAVPGAIVVALAIAGMAAFLVWNSPDESPSVRAAESSSPDENSPDLADTKLSPAQEALEKMGQLKSVEERSDHLDWIADQPWAKSSLPVFRTTIVSDPDESVQIHAVDVALKLAQAEGGDANARVVRTSLASTMGNTRARGLKAAREVGDVRLLQDMLGLVDSHDAYATMALNALAYMDSDEARAKILAIAEDGNAEPQLRERAVALLAVTKDREAIGLLYELRNGEDASLAAIAAEVLRVFQE